MGYAMDMTLRRGKPGPDPTPPAKKQSARVLVNLLPAERKALAKDAKHLGLSLSETLRRAWHKWRGD